MLRERWLAAVALGLVIAAVFGVVLAFAAGAERTSTVADRYTSAQGDGFDGLIYQQEGRPRTAEIAALPGAASVNSATFVFGAMFLAGTSDNVDSTTFSGSYAATGTQLVAGRDANPAVAGEFVASRTFIDANHAAIGDTFELKTLSQEQADATGFNTSEDPAGPTLTGVLVGVVDGPATLDDPTPIAIFSPALLDDPRVAVKVSLISVGLDAGTDLETFRASLDTLPGSDLLSLEKGVLVSAALRTAADAQALGLWALTAVAAVAAVVVLAQLLSRHVRLSDPDRSRLSSIGYGERQIVWESMGRAALPVAFGTVIGVVLATTLSGVFPTGFARRIEPHPGMRVDPGVLLLGVAVFVTAMMVCTWAGLLLSKLTPRDGSQRLPMEAIATKTGSATASTGLRFAFGRRDQDRGSVRTVVIGLAVTVACLVGALTFATSLVRLVDQPSRYGINYDFMVGNSGADSVPDDLRSALESNTDVAALLLYAEGQARFGAATLRLIGMQPIKGDVGPEVLAGRLPVSKNEIALGRLAASALHAKIGSDLSLDGDTGTEQFRVTGLAVVPSIGLNEGIGQDGILTADGLAELNPTATPSAAVIRLRPDAPDGAIERLARATGLADSELLADGTQTGSRPAAIVNIARVRSIPFVLAALLAALAVLTVGHVMLTSVHSRRRDVAILRALGADRRWIGRAVHWQATVFTLLPVAIGIPLGLIIGRIAFRSFADSIGTLNDASIPALLVVAVVAGLVVIANAVASFPARRADRVAPAVLLRPE